MGRRRLHWLSDALGGTSTICHLSTDAANTWPKGGALLADIENEVTCLWCLRQLTWRRRHIDWGKATPIGRPRDVAIGTRVLIEGVAEIERNSLNLPGSTASSAKLVRHRRGVQSAVAVGWAVRWTEWEVHGSRWHDGGPEGRPKKTGELLRIRFKPNGAEYLCYPDQVRVLPVRINSRKEVYTYSLEQLDDEAMSQLLVATREEVTERALSMLVKG